MNHALVKSMHFGAIETALSKNQDGFNETKDYLEKLVTRGGAGKFTELTSCAQEAIEYDDWNEWVDNHADEVMDGKPQTDDSEIFKEQMKKALKSMRIGKGSMKSAELVELDFTDGASQLIFGYNAICCNNKEEKVMNVLVTGFGKKWDMPEDQKLDKKWFDEHGDNLKRYLKYGALKSAKDCLEGADEPVPFIEGPLDLALVKEMHMGAVTSQLAATKPGYDAIGCPPEDDTTPNQVQCSVAYDKWPEWCEKHADEVLAHNPQCEEATVFKDAMVKSLKMMMIGRGSMKEGQMIELDYQDGANNFIFGYGAVCSNHKEKRQMHVLASAFGQKGVSVGPSDELKKYLKHATLLQTHHALASFQPPP